jgi:hypothetical protein
MRSLYIHRYQLPFTLGEKEGASVNMENIFTERLWRTVKYEDVYIKGYQIPADAQAGLGS